MAGRDRWPTSVLRKTRTILDDSGRWSNSPLNSASMFARCEMPLGIRVIYYLKSRQEQIWMLTVYARNEEESIPGHILKKIREEFDGGI